jgi:AcrR family transcriptional regulator
VTSTTPARRARLAPAERRASIVDAATEVFAKAGYQKAKMSDVAKAVGVTEPVIFQNFGTKAALYVAVLERAEAHAREAFEHQRTWHGAGAGRMLAEILSPEHLDAMHTGAEHGVLFADAISLIGDTEIGEAARRAVGALAVSLTALIAEGKRTGEFRSDLDAEAAAWSALSLMASYRFRLAVMPERERLERSVLELQLQALLADGA